VVITTLNLNPALDYFVCAQAGELSPLCFDLRHSSNQRRNRLQRSNAKSTRCIQPPQTFAPSEQVSCPAISCPAILTGRHFQSTPWLRTPGLNHRTVRLFWAHLLRSRG